MDMIAEDEEEDELLAIPSERCKPTSLEKMITLIATLVEKARGTDHSLKLPHPDLHIIAGGKVSKIWNIALIFKRVLAYMKNLLITRDLIDPHFKT